MAPSAAAHDQDYQTTSLKRKRGPPTTSSDHATKHEGPNAEARAPKKCRIRKTEDDEYNPKFMAAMCFNAYVSQRHIENNRPEYFGGGAENFQKDLVKVFTGVKKNKTFKLTVATRHTIPELARCEPRSIIKKESLTKELIAHYKSVRNDLEYIEAAMTHDGTNEGGFVYDLRETVTGLHRDLVKYVVWRDVLPYTPLPTHGLRTLRNRIRDSWGHGRFEQLEHLKDLADSIIDIEGWLSLPPRPRGLDFPADMRESAKHVMQEETEEKIRKINGKPPLSEAESLRRQLDEIKRREETRRRAEETKRGKEKQQQETEMKAAARKATQDAIKIKDAADREKKLQEEVNRLAEETRVLKAAKEAADAENEKLKAADKVHKPQDDSSVAPSIPEQKKTQQELDQKASHFGLSEKVEASQKPFTTSLNSSISSQMTGRSSPFTSQKSFGTSLDTSFGSIATPSQNPFKSTIDGAMPDDLSEEMEDIVTYDDPPKTTFGSYTPGQMQQTFSTQGGHNSASHPQAQAGRFREACRRFKSGNCMNGKRCRFAHEPCKWWKKDGSCKFGETCKNSHDPWFLTSDYVAAQRNQASAPDAMVVDSSHINLQQGSKNSAPNNPPTSAISQSQDGRRLMPFHPFMSPPSAPAFNSLPPSMPVVSEGPFVPQIHNPELNAPSGPLIDRSTKHGLPLNPSYPSSGSHRGRGATKYKEGKNEGFQIHGSALNTSSPSIAPLQSAQPSSYGKFGQQPNNHANNMEKDLDAILASAQRPRQPHQNNPRNRFHNPTSSSSQAPLNQDPSAHIKNLEAILSQAHRSRPSRHDQVNRISRSGNNNRDARRESRAPSPPDLNGVFPSLTRNEG